MRLRNLGLTVAAIALVATLPRVLPLSAAVSASVASGDATPSWPCFDLGKRPDNTYLAHPVICGGRLYLRCDQSLYAYDVRAYYGRVNP